MQYVKVSDNIPVVDHLVDVIKTHLANGRRVLWLIPGGSAIAIAVAVSKRLVGIDAANLHVTLTDERYGEVGHINSNWKQLTNAGFDVSGAQLAPLLTGTDIDETAKVFAEYLETRFSDVDYSIGLFGMGADGHTAGVLPGSSAVASSELAAHYRAPDYERITMTLPAIARLNEAVLYTVGPEKTDALEKLRKEITLVEQPAQILKQVGTLTVYNDLKGDEV